MLSESGAKLLTDDLNGLSQSVASYRPETKVRATCYRPMALRSPQTVSLTRLADRMATLEKLVAHTEKSIREQFKPLSIPNSSAALCSNTYCIGKSSR